MITNTIGTIIFTFIGLGRSGRFHRRYKRPVTDNMTKNDSTIVQYVISLWISLLINMKRDKMFCKNVKIDFYRRRCIQIRHITKNIKEGKGVNVFTLIWAKNSGKWPLRAPTNSILEEAITCTLKPPKADTATSNGMIQANFPKTLSPNV